MRESDLPLLRDAAYEAGHIARRHFGAEPETWQKRGGGGPVTEADLEVDRMLNARLTEARPGYGWLSEETRDGPARLSAERVFIVDPIDGTRSFIEGSRAFAHSIAVAERGRVIAGVVYLPMLDLLYEAELGRGAQLNGQPLAASDRGALEGAAILAARPQLDPALWPGGAPEVDRHYRPSLAWRLCLVAEGRFDGMVTLRDTWEWDIAAGCLIAAEAGAAVSDRAGCAPVFNNPGPSVPGILAGAAPVHAAMLRRLAPPKR